MCFWMPRVKPVISHPIDHQGLASCRILAQRRLKRCAKTPTIWLHICTSYTGNTLTYNYMDNLGYYLPHLISWQKEGRVSTQNWVRFSQSKKLHLKYTIHLYNYMDNLTLDLPIYLISINLVDHGLA